MEFRILGPLEAWDGERELSLGGPRPRALLALLLLHPNEVVPTDRLIDELWGEDSPDDAAAALRVNVSRLRKVAAARRADDHARPAISFASSPDELDLHRFERLVDDGAKPACPGPAGRRVSAPPRGVVAVARLGARGLRVRELRAGADRATRGDQAGSCRAPDRRRPRARAPRRAGRGARGTRRRAPAPRTATEVPDDGALPVRPAGGGAGGLPGRAPRARRRARDRAEPCAPGAGAIDTPAGPRARPPSGGTGRYPGSAGAVDSRRDYARDARRRAARGRRAARATTRLASWSSRGSCATQPSFGRRRPGSRSGGRRSQSRGARGTRSIVHVDGAW